MKEEAILLHDLPGPIVDLDVTPDGSFVAITAAVDDRVVYDDGPNSLRHSFYRDQQLVFGAEVVRVFPDERPWPLMVRSVAGRAIVVQRRAKRREPNAWIVERSGQIAAEFCAGDGIEDIVVLEDHIVFTYFDEGIFGGAPPAEQGVAVFDPTGHYEFGYYDCSGSGAPDIADCYAACADEAGRLLIFPYTEFPIIRIDLSKRSREVFPAPETLTGAHAMTSSGEQAFLWSPYDYRDEIFGVLLGTNRAKAIGRYPGPLRGLPGGRFLAVGSSGYTVVSMVD